MEETQKQPQLGIRPNTGEQRIDPSKDLDFGKALPGNPLIDRPLNLPDVNRPINPISFPRLYSNPETERNLQRNLQLFSGTLAQGEASVNAAVARANAVEAERTARAQQQTEIIRKAIAQQKAEENTGLAALLFGRKKDYTKNRTVNPLAGDFGEQGGGLFGFLGYVLDAFNGVAASTNAQNFANITPNNPNRSFRAGSNYWRALGESFLSNLRQSSEFNQELLRNGFDFDKAAKALATKQAAANARLVAATRDLMDLDRDPREKIGAVSLFDKALPPSVRSMLAAVMPTNWAIGLNPFVKDIGLNNRMARSTPEGGSAYLRNLSKVFTEGRQFGDTNNPLTKDGLFYDPKRLVNGKDTYGMKRKIASGLWNALITPGDVAADALLIEPLLKPALGKSFRFVATPLKRKVTNTIINESTELASVRKADDAIKKADELLARTWWKLPQEVSGEKVPDILKRYGGVMNARESLRAAQNGTLKLADDELLKLEKAVTIHEHKRFWRSGYKIDPSNFKPKPVLKPEEPPPTKKPTVSVVSVAEANIPRTDNYGITPKFDPKVMPTGTSAIVRKPIEVLGSTPEELANGLPPLQTIAYLDSVSAHISGISEATKLPEEKVAKYLTGELRLDARARKKIDTIIGEIEQQKIAGYLSEETPAGTIRRLALPPAKEVPQEVLEKAIANDLAAGVVSESEKGSIMQILADRLSNQEVLSLAPAGSTPEATLSIRDLAIAERKAKVLRDTLDIPDAYEVAPKADGSFEVFLTGNPQAKVVVSDDAVEFLGQKLPKSKENISEAMDIVLSKNSDLIVPSEVEAIASSVSDVVNAEIHIPTVIKVSDPVTSGHKAIPGSSQKISKVTHGTILRSDGSLVVNVLDLTKGLGDIPRTATIGFPTKLGMLTLDEIDALPKASLSYLLEDLQAARQEVISGMQSLANKNFAQVALPIQPDRRIIEAAQAFDESLKLVPGTIAPLSEPAILKLKKGTIGYHGTAVADWKPVRDAGTEAINRFGFGTYIGKEEEVAKAASLRIYDATHDTALELGNPTVYKISAERELKLLHSFSKVDKSAIIEFAKAVGDENISAMMSKLPPNATIDESYSFVINSSIEGGTLNEEMARKGLAFLDNYISRLGYDGIADVGTGQYKLTNLSGLTVEKVSETPNAAATTKLDLLEAAIANHTTSQPNKFANVVDWSRYVDDRHELLAQMNSVLDDLVSKAEDIRVAQTEIPVALEKIPPATEYYDDLLNLSDSILDDPCGF